VTSRHEPRFDWGAIHARLRESQADGARERAMDLLRRRAEQLGAPIRAGEEQREALTILVLRAGGERIGLPVEHVAEVARLGGVTPLPGRADGIAGVTSLRGEPHCVIDLRRILGLADGGRAGRFGVVLRRPLAGLVLAVDEAVGLGRLPRGRSRDPDPRSALPTRYLRGRTPEGVGLLDLTALAAHEVFERTGRGATASAPHAHPAAVEEMGGPS
jgi:purine-binding chemotaxis protein CheW